MRSLAKRAYHALLTKLPDEAAVSLDFFLAHRRLPHLKEPRTFSEKIQYRKLYNKDPRFPVLADKFQVKDYVREALGEQWLIPSIWYGKALPPREERNWPIPYVLKATHGSGQNIFVASPDDQNWELIEERAEGWLHNRYGTPFREWLYGQITPGLLVEPYVGCGDILPVDYKFYVFGGEVRTIQVDTGRAQNHRRCFYDRKWKPQPFALMYPLETSPIAKPASLDAMIEAAEHRGRDFAFVRVDLYEVEGRPLFGEMTFYPESGRGVFSPPHYDRMFGNLWPTVYCHVRRRESAMGARPALPSLEA